MRRRTRISEPGSSVRAMSSPGRKGSEMDARRLITSAQNSKITPGIQNARDIVEGEREGGGHNRSFSGFLYTHLLTVSRMT